MKKLDLKKEWSILNFELFKNKSKKALYPKKIVEKRKLLLLAQCLLSDYGSTKSKIQKNIFGTAYKSLMQLYFNKRDVLKNNYAQLAIGKVYIIKKYAEAVNKKDKNTIDFCKSILDIYDKFKFNDLLINDN